MAFDGCNLFFCYVDSCLIAKIFPLIFACQNNVRFVIAALELIAGFFLVNVKQSGIAGIDTHRGFVFVNFASLCIGDLSL